MNDVKTSRAGRFLPIVIAILALAVVACVCTGGGASDPTPAAGTTTGGTTTGGTTTGGTTTGGATTEPTPAAGSTTGGTTTGGTTTGGTTTGGTTTDGGTTTTDGGTTDGSEGTDTDLEIVNNTAGTICYVYIASSTDATDWGDEVLGADVIIGVNETNVVSGPPGVYDIILEDCDHNVVAWNYGADLTADTTLTVSGSPDTLIVENTSSFDICGIYISSPDETSFGRSHLNPAHPITSGQTRSFAVTAGTWDLRAQPCDSSIEPLDRYGESLSGDITWTLTNE